MSDYAIPLNEVYIVKKDGSKQPFNPEKIIQAISKSAARVCIDLTSRQKLRIVSGVVEQIDDAEKEEIPILLMHSFVELALDRVSPDVAKSYRDYRNYKNDFVYMMDDIAQYDQSIKYLGDKENANKDSSLSATQQALLRSYLGKTLYKKFFLLKDEKEAIKDGYIYVHDMDSRRDTMNCCLFNMQSVLTGGFEFGNIWYNEPKTLDVAFDVIGDIVLSAASQQYGGFTIPEIDKILEPYAEKSYKKYFTDYKKIVESTGGVFDKNGAHEYAMEKVKKETAQGFQGWEMKFNTVASSRGDYPFITITLGLAKSDFGKLAAKTALEVRRKGQGKKGFEKAVLFPKIVFLYDKNLHGQNGELRDVRNAALKCSSETMYPDWLSLTGKGYIADMYKKYGKVVSPMGCRAFLSPWYKRGGMYPTDEYDEPEFVGRFNIGVVSLNLPMILAKARQEQTDFHEVLDYYLEMIRKLHLRTYDYLGNLKAGINPLGFCQGGFLGGHLHPQERIEPVLDSATASFGITALNELQELYNGKSITEDGSFALEVLQYINEKVDDFKKKDGRLYAIYGTPAENLCGVQVKQFRKKYGIVENVSDREYVSNSFHCHVSEKILPTEKQNKEYRFWELCNGGKIQYVKYPIGYNLDALSTLIDRAMEMGYYEGINLDLSYCDDCGHKFQDDEIEDVCPSCGSKHLTKINRMNGYLAYSQLTVTLPNGQLHTYSRLSDHKMAEVKDRYSM